MQDSHEQEGGEPACWLNQVCEECGRVREQAGRAECEHCGHDPAAGGRSRAGADRPRGGRDRDPEGKARNARPRDGLGRPLPYGEEGVARQPEGVLRTPAQTLREAQRLLDEGKPFHAHEVFEDAWKSSPGQDQPLWKGLAQLAVGITHLARGNTRGGARLLVRGADGIAPWAPEPPHGIDVAAVEAWARKTADEIEARATGGPVTVRPPSLRGTGAG
ncbi:DUF309 domain-containing protein [Streptomyces ovatisporus]|uniref:DUF309 domain-containing protein n=1 Tax=Streptomyces ovatisporus TaxID=1128682 RepID=A0ABV9ADG2_9ACTN